MARIRTIKPKFWDDEKLAKVSRDARLLYIGMWNYADDLGVILANQTWLKSKIFPYDDISAEELKKWLQELLDISRIVTGTFRDDSYFRIVNFTKHQVINKPNNADIFVPSDCISSVFTIPVSITEQYGNDTESIKGGKERKGKERIIQEEKKTFSMIQIYDKSWDEYKEILNGQAKHLNEELFKEWKEFVDFIYENEMTDLFSCKFLSPIDFGKMKKDVPFPRSEWLNILKKILSTGIKPEHILLYRIPEFIGYAKKGIYPQSAKSSYQEEVEAKRKNFKPTEA
jgi:hypothetical protein